MFKREHKQARSKKDGLRRLSKHQPGPDEAELREAERRAHSRGSFQRQERPDPSYLPPSSGPTSFDELLDSARSPRKAAASSDRKAPGRDEDTLSELRALRAERKALEQEMKRRDAMHDASFKHIEQELSSVQKQLERSWRENSRLGTELERSVEEQRSLADIVNDMQREIEELEQRRQLPPSVDMSFDALNAMHREALARAEAVAAVLEEKRRGHWQQARRKQVRTVDCLICMDAPVDTMLAPCNHILSCSACSAKLATCPICRTYVADRVRIVLS